VLRPPLGLLHRPPPLLRLTSRPPVAAVAAKALSGAAQAASLTLQLSVEYKTMKRILSLGAGVQSSTLALMIAHGELEPIDAAIFADTQWEPRAVYEWLDWLEAEIQRCPHPFPIYRVTEGNLRQLALTNRNTTGNAFAVIPWFVRNGDGTKGMGRRQCTREFKLKPIRRKSRELAGLAKGQRAKGVVVEQLIGISTDEAFRMKPSRDKWAVNRWPLIDLNMSRADCLTWMARKQYPQPAKSSCIGCPFHSLAQWREIKNDAEQWADVLEIDAAIRQAGKNRSSQQFMNDARVPMADLDMTATEAESQVDMFNNECEGMCGV
jgi:hypothetical protein